MILRYFKHTLYAATLLVSVCAHAQQWAFMKGSTLADQFGIYGTQGVSAATNMPGARYAAPTWVDNNGKFWMFGGGGKGASGFTAIGLSDLWMYDPVTNEWTWVKGPTIPDQVAVYGAIGVPAAANNPGGRQGSSSWKDNDGNFWMFGGLAMSTATNGGHVSNDLWKFDLTLGQWTCMRASGSGVNGTQGVSAAANMPLARNGAMTWTSANGDLWLFGGDWGFNNPINDLWKYNISSNEWTWVNGASGPPSNYGTQGVAASFNMPGGRVIGTTWTDNTGDLWLFGGRGVSATTNGILNDLWKYNISSNQWTWINGGNTPNLAGNYGTLGVAAISNVPASRQGANSWKDNAGNLWLFGGYSASPLGPNNDVWKYNIGTNQWTWMQGSNTVGQSLVYGTQGVSAPANTPGANANIGWNDAAGNFWLLGGYNSATPGNLSDLWKFEICSYFPASPVNTTPAGALGVCAGTTVNLSVAGSTNNVNWYASLTSTQSIASGTSYTAPALSAGNYTVYAQATGCQPGINRTSIIYTISALPVVSVNSGGVCAGSVYTIMPSGASTYTISGGSATVMPLVTTAYSITGANIFGCASSNTAIATVSVNALPVITVNSGSVCSGSSFTLLPAGASTYTISGGLATVMLLTTATYSVTGTNIFGCVSSNAAIATVSVNSLPVITVNSGSVCSGSSFTMLPAGAATYTYSSGFDVVTPAITSSYTITGTDQNGCVSLPVISAVSVNPTPTLAAVSSSTLICNGETAAITVSGANFYTWSTGSNVASIVVNPTVTTQYLVTGMSAGCYKTITVTQNVNECTGINVQQLAAKITIYPNPTNGNFTIQSSETITLQLINELGQLVQVIDLNADQNTAMITNLNNGIYFISGATPAGLVKQKIIVSK